MSESKPTGFPTLAYEGVTTTVTRWWSRFSKWRNSDDNDDDSSSLTYENRHTEDIPLKSILKEKNGGKQKKVEQMRTFEEVADIVVELNKYDTRGRKREAVSHRKGPLLTAELPPSERGQRRLTHAQLNVKSFDNVTGDLASSNAEPRNRGLLTYFSRIAETANEGENVDLLFVESLVNDGAEVNVGDKYGQTILHAITRDWRTDMVKYAIAKGADTNKRDKYGRTPLHVAAAANYPDMIEFLIKNGAILDARTEGEDQTPVHYAAKNNAVDSMKCLLKLGGRITDRDYKQRTPLFLAAEEGREDMVAYLLEFGAASAVYDSQGNCAVALMVDTMPKQAYKALNQFLTEKKASRTSYYYLSNLDFDTTCKLGRTPAKPVLEAIVYNKDLELAKHPVIQKMIAVKWSKFAGFKASLDIIVNILYACVFTSLTMALPETGFYYPLSKWGWRFGMEALFLLMTFYLVYVQAKAANLAKKRHAKWKDWRVRYKWRDIKYCHPQWPDERRHLKQNIERIQDMPATYFRNGWNWYEWISFFGIIAIVVAQIVYHITHEENVRFVVKITYTVELLLIWLRLLKPFRTLPSLSALIVMLGGIMIGSARLLVIFALFFFPTLTAFYVMFGGEGNAATMRAAGIDETDIESYTSLGYMVYTLFIMVVSGNFETGPYEAIQRKLSHVMIALSVAVLNVLFVNLFIALYGELFQRVHKHAQANALLQRAEYVLQAEWSLSQKRAKRIRKYIRTECGPLERYEPMSKASEEGNNLDEIIQSASQSIKSISSFFGKEYATVSTAPDSNGSVLKSITNDLDHINQSNEMVEQLFNEKWAKIKENQREIAELLDKPEVKEFLEQRKSTRKSGEKNQR
eukprot:gene6244-6963_t